MASTMRVDVCYRPLRIGWAVRAGDIDAIRQAMAYSHALWGGRFNPIIVIDKEDEARQLIESFRLDLIWPLGDSQEIKDFLKKFPHLIRPFYGESIFVKDDKFNSHFAQALDISNAISHWHTKPEWKSIKEGGIRDYHWQPEDPLADVFLMQFGTYPSPDEIGVDYLEILSQVAETTIYELLPHEQIPPDVTHNASLEIFSRLGLEPHYSIRARPDSPGFFVGSADDPEDLVCYWNLRAADIPIWFVDPIHLDRYTKLIPELASSLLSMIEHRLHEWDRRLGVWSRGDIKTAARIFEGMDLICYHIDDNFWSQGIILPPMMYFGDASTLGVMDESEGAPRVNFAFTNKPFDSSLHFNQQHLVASISFIGLHGDEQHTFNVPYVPELNEFYARSMHFRYQKLRVEPERIGLVISATDHDSFLKAMPVGDLLQRIFSMAGFESKLSNSGRIVRQLITQLGGLQGARVFKIPGARELIKKFGPRNTFSRRTANTIITDKKQGAVASFSAHVNLFLSPRPLSTKLTPPDVFTHMVDKGLFRIGADLDCAKCGMSSWIALDELKQQATCELCGHKYDATQQLLGSDWGWGFRRSGVLGAERNAQGAVPVALTLQQLGTAFDHVMSPSIYSPSLDLTPAADSGLPKCEVDFAWLMNGQYPLPSSVILAECKDQGPINPEEFKRDVENMRRVADALPRHRFNVYILFVKLAPFTDEEIALASTLNGQYTNRVILLTARELEPYDIYERIQEHGIRNYGASPKDLADMTQQLYFTKPDAEDPEPRG